MIDEAAELPRAIERFLRATYRGNRRQSNEPTLRQYAREVKAKAFPKFATELDFIFLNSRRRSCRQVVHGDKGFIIIDQGQTALVAIEDFILRAHHFDADDSLTLLQVPFAEAFRRNNELERALMCIERCLAQGPRLGSLLRSTFNEAGHSTLGLFLLLHEIAHFAVDTEQPFTTPVRALVTENLTEHCQTNERYGDLLETGQPLPPNVESSAQDQSLEARAQMARQMREHVRFVKASREVVREANCDFLAVTGMLTWRSGVDVHEAESPEVDTLTRRNVGDILTLGLRVSRLLMLQHFLDLTAENIAQQQEPSRLTYAFSEMTARHNVSVSLALRLFEGIMETWRFAEPPESVDYVQAFRQGVEVLNTRSADRLLHHVENIGLDHRDAERYGRDLAILRAQFFRGEAPGRRELEVAVNANIAKLPI